MAEEENSGFDCDECRQKGLPPARNCAGRFNPVKFKVFDEVFQQCPVNLLSPDETRVIGMINMSEGGGMGGSRVLPTALLEEAEFYFSIRNIVVHEQVVIQRFKDALAKQRRGNR